MSTSPTTSTPGSSPEGSKRKGLKSSELLHSDESLVDISTEHPTTIEIDSAMEVTLDGKSVDKASTSPTTSTPGSSPDGSQNNGLKSSELLYNDESLVEASTEQPTTIEVESAMEGTVNDNIVDTITTQDIYDAACETTRDYTKAKEEYIMSCIAQRTRSRTAEMRKYNLSQLLAVDSWDEIMEDDYEIVASKAVDSLTLPKYNKERLKIWYDTLMTLDTSIDNVTILEESMKQDDIIKMYSNKTADMIKRSNEIQPLQEAVDEDLEREIKEIRDSTFVIEKPQYESALVEVIKALETLANMDLSITPAKKMESILRIILAICIDYHIKVQSIQDTMISMAKFIRELLVLGCKLEVTDRNSKRLEEEKKKLRSEVENLRAQLVSTNQFLNRQMIEGTRSGSEIAQEITGLETRVKTLEEKATEEEAKLKQMRESKEYYKLKAQEGQIKLDNITIVLNAERERNKNDRNRDNIIKKNLIEDKAKYADYLLEAKEEIKGKIDDMEKMKRKYKVDNEKILQKYEVQSCLKTLIEKIEHMRSLEKRIKNLKQEVSVWRKMCVCFWEQDPKTVYDPKNPPPSVEIDTEEEDSGIIESVDTSTADIHGDTSTAGIFGDIEDYIDLTLSQERDTAELDLNPNPVISERDPNPDPNLPLQRDVNKGELNDRKTENGRNTKKVRVKAEKMKESNSSSAENMSPEQAKEDRKKKSCRSKTNYKYEIHEEVKILKDHSQQLRDQSMKQRKEIENLRKEVEKLKMVVKGKDQEIIKITENKKTVQEENSETQTEKQGYRTVKTQTPEIGGQPEDNLIDFSDTSEIGGQQGSEIGANPIHRVEEVHIPQVSDKGDPPTPREEDEQNHQLETTATSKIGEVQNSQIGEVQVPQTTSQIGTTQNTVQDRKTSYGKGRF